jgi:hypothetical protein
MWKITLLLALVILTFATYAQQDSIVKKNEVKQNHNIDYPLLSKSIQNKPLIYSNSLFNTFGTVSKYRINYDTSYTKQVYYNSLLRVNQDKSHILHHDPLAPYKAGENTGFEFIYKSLQTIFQYYNK